MRKPRVLGGSSTAQQTVALASLPAKFYAAHLVLPMMHD